MKGKRLLILGAAFALGISACAQATRITKQAPLREGEFGNLCTLVKDVNELSVDDNIVIGNGTGSKVKFLSSTQNTNNRGVSSEVDVSDGTAPLPNNAEVLTLGKEDGNWTLYANLSSTKGYLYAASSSNNYLKTQASVNANAEWAISVNSTGVASIVAQGSNSRNVMQYNATSSLFACYGSASQTNVSIWKVGNSSEPIQLVMSEPQYDSDNNKVVWADVSGADYYEVSIGNELGYAEETSPYDGNFQSGTSYTVYVRACGDGVNYLTSDGKSVTFTAVAPFVGTEYVLCTSAADLVVGASYIVTSGTEGTVKTMSTESSTNNRKITDVVVSNSSITSTKSTLTLTLGGSSGLWTFHTDNYLGTNGYFASASSNDNHLEVLENGTDHCTISFDENKAVITFSSNSNGKNIVRYNSSNSCFSCYASGQADVYLWKDANAGTAPVFGELDHIKISTPASKTSFYVGETFSSAGLVLTGYDAYNEATALTETYSTGYTTDFDGKVFGEEDVGEGKMVTVTYGGKPAYYYINVNAPIEKTVAEALDIANALESGAVSADLYKVEGYIVSIVTAWSTQYNNISYMIGDTADATDTLEVYRSVAAEGTNGPLLQVGDKVSVVGYLKNHNGTTPEFDSGCVTTLVQGVPAEKITVVQALAIANALASDVKSDKEYEVEGYIVSIVTAWSTQYNNISYMIGDTAGASTTIEVFRSVAAEGTNGSSLKIGDKVSVVGYLKNHSGTTPEFDAGCVTSLIEASEGIEPYIDSFSSFAKLNARESGPETITFGNLNLQNAVQYTEPFEAGDYSVTFGGGANDGKYYTDGAAIRTYGNGTITIASNGSNIKSITLVWTGGANYKPASADVVSEGTYNTSTGVWTGDASSVTFTRPSGSGHWRLQSLTISSGSVTIDQVSLEFGATISKSSWGAIEGNSDWPINEFGVMLFKTRQDSVPTVEEVFNATPAKTIAINDSQYGVTLEEDGDNYKFSVKINISGSASYDIFFCAAPYIVIDGDYYFLDNMKYSVQSLATYYQSHSGSGLSTDALSILAGN